MKIDDLTMKRLLPSWMRGDEANIGLSASVDKVAKKFYRESQVLSRWNQIDNMTENNLDELAWDLNIPWYVSTADIEIKRKIVKNSILVHAHLGTIEAVNMVIQDYFGEGEVEEWFEYGGDPCYFRITSNNAQLVLENYQLFCDLLAVVKRESAWLDHITIQMMSDATVYAGAAVHDKTHETIRILQIAEPEKYHLRTDADEQITTDSGDSLSAYVN